jgi:hypothetical protein
VIRETASLSGLMLKLLIVWWMSWRVLVGERAEESGAYGCWFFREQHDDGVDMVFCLCVFGMCSCSSQDLS